LSHLKVNAILTREEFKNTFDSHFESVRNYIYYRSGDKELASDVAQETFMKYWEKRSEHENGNGHVKGLLFKIAGDLFISSYRKKIVAMKYPVLINKEEFSHSPEEELTYKEMVISYEKALTDLPDKQRVVFLLNRMEGLKYREIALNLGLSVKAVEKRMKNALEFLRRAIVR
jgi:RNA polymerase sigma factor (sigma-70 family)